MAKKLFILSILFLSLYFHLFGQTAVVFYNSPFKSFGEQVVGIEDNTYFLLNIRESSDVEYPITNGLGRYKTQTKIALADSNGLIIDSLFFGNNYDPQPDTNYFASIQLVENELWILLYTDFYRNDSVVGTKNTLLRYSQDLLEFKESIEIPDSMHFISVEFLVRENEIIVSGRSLRHPGIFFNEENYYTVKHYDRVTKQWTDTREPSEEFLNGPAAFNKIAYNPERKEYYWIYEFSQDTRIIRYDSTQTLINDQLFESPSHNAVYINSANHFTMASNFFNSQDELLLLEDFNFQYSNQSSIGFLAPEGRHQSVPTRLKYTRNGDLLVGVNDLERNPSAQTTTSRILYMGPVGNYDIVHEVPLQLKLNGGFYLEDFEVLDDSAFAAFGTAYSESFPGKNIAALFLTDQNGVTGIESLNSPNKQQFVVKNPVDDFIKMDLAQDAFPADIIITNTLGQIVLSKTGQRQNTFEVGDLSAGIYTLKLKTQSGDIFTQRIIKN